MVAKRRLFAPVGPGLKQIREGADGKIYVLASPSPGLVVYSPEARRLLTMREAAALPEAALAEAKASGEVLVQYGEDCDVDPDGTIYVVDRSANSIQVYSIEGKHLRTVSVNAPVAVAALPEGEVAVATLRQPALVTVFDKNGRLVREFGDSEQLTNRADLNRYLNIGNLASDAQGHLYYGFEYFPEPTVRQFDRFGYAAGDLRYASRDVLQDATARGQEAQNHGRRRR